MKNTFKKLLLCFLAAAAVIMGSAAVKSVGNAENSGEPDKNVSLAAAAKQGYCLRDWQGYIAVLRMTAGRRNRNRYPDGNAEQC